MNRASRYLTNVSGLTFVRVVIVGVIVCMCHHATPSDGKVFERCELAQLLRYGHGLDVNDVANWVCIAQHSSSLNSSAFGGDARSGSHGLFQISDQYWCSPPGKGVACGVSCDKLRDDDIGDDLECIRTIYAEHQRLSGDGYTAWVAYQPFCRENPYEYVEDCFGNEEREYLHSKSITANYVEDEEEDEADYEPYPSKKRGKVYGRCELAKELFLKHKMPMEEIPTWVCIAQHESNYDTSAVGRLNADGSADHGLFQISDLYWCSHKGSRRKACGLPCSKLLDSDITDDVKCVKQIFKEHTRISGDGFTAWTVYNAYCHGKTANYVRGCFDGIDIQDPSASEEYRTVKKPSRVGKHQKPHGKVYEPCELAEELRTKHHLPEDQIATWVCIAKHESDYNTSAIGYGDHGLFQISDIYWCSPPGKGWACGLSCADLEDSDISDDVECIRKIYAEHTHLSGDGFNAWTVYPRHCSDGRAEKYISHCGGNNPRPAVTAPPHTHSKLTNPNSIEDDYQPKRGKIYGRCELAKELLTKYDMSMDEIPTWVCIAHHESNYDTSAVGRRNTDGSADHGLFQISDLYWCSHKEGHRKACGLPCSKLLDNDISDDIKCVKQIHDEHTRISGDGFTAWTVYNAYCRERTEQYIRGCFDGSASIEDFKPRQRTPDIGFPPKNKPKGKVYEECELANELRDKHHIPREQISTWVCIAKHQSGLNTSSSVSDVHGMFHISDEYWCSPPGKGKVCELNCADLEDSDISDDVDCINKIYLEHQRLFGNGFSAWVVYPQHCSDGRADDYVGHCPGFEAPRTNAIAYATPKLISVSNKPVYNHVFSENPFLRHVDVVDTDAASKTFSEPIEELFSASDEVDTILPANHEFSLNPFLKSLKPKQENPKETPFKTTTSPPAFLGVPIAPTPTKSSRLQTYQPQNEEHAKYEAFKAFATPSLPLTTQVPRADRLQTYQLNTSKGFKTFPTPTLPTTQVPSTTTNRLQPYQLSTLHSFKTTATPITKSFTTKTLQQPQSYTKPYTLTKTATPTLQPLSSKIPLPTAQSKPYTSTRAPLTSASKDSGRYDSGRYDSGRYDAGRYDPGRYNPQISQPTSQPSRSSTNSNSKPDTKPTILSSGKYPIATPTLQYKAPTSIKITSTSLKSFQTSTQKPEQPLNTRSPSVSTNSGRYEPFKVVTIPAVTTKIFYDPFKQLTTTTVKPTTTATSSKKFEAYKAINSGKYVPYKPPSTPKDTGKYIPNKSSSQTTKSSSTIVTKPTKKFDPFKPFGQHYESYDPFKAFSTRQQQFSSPSKATSSNELDSGPSSNSKRETQTSGSTSNLRISLTSKRETRPSQQKKPATSSPVIVTKPQVTATSSRISSTQTSKAPSRQITVTPTVSSRSATASTSKPNVVLKTTIRSDKPVSKPTLSAYRQNTATPTRIPSKSTSIVTSKPTVSPYHQNTPTRQATTSTSTTKPLRLVQTTTRPSTTGSPKASSIVTSKPSVSAYRQTTATPTRLPPTSPSITKPQQLTQTTRSAAIITSKPTLTAYHQNTATSTTRAQHLTQTATKQASIVPAKPAVSLSRQTRSTKTEKTSLVPSSSNLGVYGQSTATPSSPFKTTIKATATVTTPQPSVVPTRTVSQKSLNPSKVTATPTRSPTRSTTKRPSTVVVTAISPTKSHRSSESLYSSKLNIYDLYYKLYGVHPPHRTSSGAQQVTKTTQTNVVPSRTS